MDLRQDAPRRRRPAHAAARPAVHPAGRTPKAGVVERSVRHHRRQAERRAARAHRRDRGRSLRGGRNVRLEGPDGLMIIGANPRKEAPVLNARIRKRWRTGNLKIGVIGEKADLTYDYTYLGAGPETLATFTAHGKASLERQIWLIGQGALARPD